MHDDKNVNRAVAGFSWIQSKSSKKKSALRACLNEGVESIELMSKGRLADCGANEGEWPYSEYRSVCNWRTRRGAVRRWAKLMRGCVLMHSLRQGAMTPRRCLVLSVQFSLASWPIGSSGGGGHEGRLSRDPLPVFSAGGPCEQFWHGQGCPLFDVHPAFPLPTTALPTLQSALKDGFGEAVVACNMPEPRKFPSLDSCQRRFLWTDKEVDLATHLSLILCSKEEVRRGFLKHFVP